MKTKQCKELAKECISLHNKQMEDYNLFYRKRMEEKNLEMQALARIKYKNIFPEAEYKNGCIYICGDKFELQRDGNYATAKYCGHRQINSKEDYGCYLKYKRENNIFMYSVIGVLIIVPLFIFSPLIFNF